MRYGAAHMVVAVACAACGVASERHGERVPPPEPPVQEVESDGPNFGQLTLSDTLDPDPLVVEGRSGGSVAASSLDPQCKGYISTQPDHAIVATASLSKIRVLVNSAGDTTLVLRRPDGSYLCNDDGEDKNPVLETALVAGRYELYVGSYRPGTRLRYRLGVSQLESTTAVELGLFEADGSSGEAAFGTISLRPGFMPDPHVVSGQAGGFRSSARLQEGCSGWIGDAPDHILVAESSFEQLRVLVRARRDTSLIVRKPDGSYFCADDNEGKNPVLEGAFPRGRYRIWVGTFRQGKDVDYHLGFTLLSSTRTRDVR